MAPTTLRTIASADGVAASGFSFESCAWAFSFRSATDWPRSAMNPFWMSWVRKITTLNLSPNAFIGGSGSR